MRTKEPTDLVVITKTYDLLGWMMDRVDRFPRSQRFLLGDRLISGLLDVLGLLIEARYSSQGRLALLRKVNIELEKLRYAFRLAKDKKLVALKSFEYGAKGMDQVGRLVGGWAKAGRQRQ